MSEESPRILVPVGESSTFRNTVAYAVREARSAAEETGQEAVVHFVYPVSWSLGDQEEPSAVESVVDLLDRTRVWAEDDLDFDEDGEPDTDVPVSIESAIVGEDRYLFSSGDFADVLSEYAHDRGLDRAIIDPEYQMGGNAPMLQPFEVELARSGLVVQEAPVERPARRGRILTRQSVSKVVSTFSISYAFYLLLAGSFGTFDLVTGAVTATLVTIIFSRVTFVGSPSIAGTVMQAGRFLLYVPYLIWEIAKANLSVAYIILHPDLPIDPKMVRFRAAVWGDLPVTTLANSITLTPGTLSVDVDPDGLDIHTLSGSAHTDIAEGSLERAVRFVFYGRSAVRIATPAERGSITPDGKRSEETE